jgi:hypothetical protein
MTATLKKRIPRVPTLIALALWAGPLLVLGLGMTIALFSAGWKGVMVTLLVAVAAYVQGLSKGTQEERTRTDNRFSRFTGGDR